MVRVEIVVDRASVLGSHVVERLVRDLPGLRGVAGMAVVVDVGDPDLLRHSARVAGAAPDTAATGGLRRAIEVDGQLAAHPSPKRLLGSARDQAAVGLDEDRGGPEVDLLALVLEVELAVAPHVHVAIRVRALRDLALLAAHEQILVRSALPPCQVSAFAFFRPYLSLQDLFASAGPPARTTTDARTSAMAGEKWRVSVIMNVRPPMLVDVKGGRRSL